MHVNIIAFIKYRQIYKYRVCGKAMKDHPEGRKLIGLCPKCTPAARYNVCISQVTLKMQMLNQDDKEVTFSFFSKSAKQIIDIAQEAVKGDDPKLALAC